ncbi:MAG TPA: 1,4-alpha-glucan branching enzyme [Opitutae bacterium]|nr:1,4-alpha-glucan branching enzyme [Opitutae bacterium]
MIIQDSEIKSCLSGRLGDPHFFLGVHRLEKGNKLVARALDTYALEITLVSETGKFKVPLKKIAEGGLFEVVFNSVQPLGRYRFISKYKNSINEWTDPYSFKPYFQEERLRSFNQGTDRRPFQKLGSIPVEHQGVSGISFLVWAPSAKSVHLVGDFNLWDPVSLPMRSLGSSGCRELFVPFAKIGDKYKFRILGADGVMREKTDPFAFRFEPPPGNASIIQSPNPLVGCDLQSSRDPRTSPLSVYEMHIGSWKHHQMENRPLSYLELADELPAYLSKMGFSHVEFLPPSEYPYGASWGYQVTGYYAPTYRYGTPEEFAVLIQRLKEKKIKVIIDWVPAHFPTDDFSLSRFDGTCLFEHEDPRQGRHAEWGTLCYNYGRAEVRSFLIGSAISWIERFGVDGFRVDAVASMLYLDYGRKDGEWVPNCHGGNHNLEAIEFLKQFNQVIHEEFPDVVSIAEESTAFPKITQPTHMGGLGFDFKWNMGWMHDILGYFSTSPEKRSHSHDQLTFGAMYQFSENFVQAFSHDEVVHGKGSLVNKMNLGEEGHRLANLRSMIALQWTWPGKKTLFMGCEFGQWKEWDFEASLDWELLEFSQHQGLSTLVADLNNMYLTHPTWAESDHESDKFEWIDCNDAEGQTLSFVKFGATVQDTLLVACNFSSQLCDRDWGCPHSGEWEVALDSNALQYGGKSLKLGSRFSTFEEPRNDQTFGLRFSIERWSVLILKLKS